MKINIQIQKLLLFLGLIHLINGKDNVKCYECKYGPWFDFDVFDNYERDGDCVDDLIQGDISIVSADLCFAFKLEPDDDRKESVIRGGWSKGEQLPFEDFEDFTIDGIKFTNYYCDEDLCNSATLSTITTALTAFSLVFWALLAL